MTNKELYNIWEGIQQAKEIAFPARVTFALVKNTKMIMPIVESLVEARNQLLRAYGEEDPEIAGKFTILPGKVKEFTQEMEALDKIENDITFQKIKMSDIESLNLSVQVMEALFPMIEEED